MTDHEIPKIFSFDTDITVDDIQETNHYLYLHRDEFTKLAYEHLKIRLEAVQDRQLLVNKAMAVFHSLKEDVPFTHQLFRIINAVPATDELILDFKTDLFLQLYTSGESYIAQKGFLNGELITAAIYKPEVVDILVNFYLSCPAELKKNTLYILVNIPNLISEDTSFVEHEAIKALQSKDEKLERVGIHYLSSLHPSKDSLITLGIPLLLKYETYDDVYNNYGLKLSKVKQFSDADFKTLIKVIPKLPIATHVKDPYLHHNCGSPLEERIDKLLVKKDKWDIDDWEYVEKRGYYRFLLPSLYIRYDENREKVTVILKRILEANNTYAMHEEHLGTTKDILTFMVAKQQIDKQVVEVVFYFLLHKKDTISGDIDFYLMILKNYPDLRTYPELLSQLVENYGPAKSHSALFTELIEAATPVNSPLRNDLLQQIQYY